MTPIGKGSRFLVLSGDRRGQTGAVAAGVSDGRWILDVVGERSMLETTAALEGPNFKRLADAPPEIDPLYVEIERCAIPRGPGYDDTIVGAGGIADEIRSALDDIEEGESDMDWLASHRAAFVEMARLCLLGIRRIDRKATS